MTCLRKTTQKSGTARSQARSCSSFFDVHEVSQFRACAVLKVDRSKVGYSSVRPHDANLRKAIRNVAQERRRFGYSLIGVMLERQVIIINHKDFADFIVNTRYMFESVMGVKGPWETRRPVVFPDRINGRWSLDFVSDAFTDGRRFRVLAVIYDYSRSV